VEGLLLGESDVHVGWLTGRDWVRSEQSDMYPVCLPCCPVRIDKRHVSFGGTVYHEIEADPNAWKKPITTHARPGPDGYQHSDRVRGLCIRREEQKCRLRAECLHTEVLLDLDEMLIINEPVVGRRRGALKTLLPEQVTAISSLENVARRWLVDSGCPLDLIASDDLTNEEKSFVQKLLRGIRFHTANGNTRSDDTISFRIDGLPGDAEAHILESTPTVLSMGKRCMEMGYGFHWYPHKPP